MRPSRSIELLRRAYELARRDYERALYRGDAAAMARAEGWERVALVELLQAGGGGLPVRDEPDPEDEPTLRVVFSRMASSHRRAFGEASSR